MTDELGDIETPRLTEEALRNAVAKFSQADRQKMWEFYTAKPDPKAILPVASPTLLGKFADAGLVERSTTIIKHAVTGTAKPPAFKTNAEVAALLPKVMNVDGRLIYPPEAACGPDTKLTAAGADPAVEQVHPSQYM